jgi:hypothetical protein
MMQTSRPLQSHPRDSYAPLPAISSQADLFACDDPPEMGQYLQYTPLQPSRVLGVQPSTSGEEMLYPQTPSRTQFYGDQGSGQATGLGIEGNDQLAVPMEANSVLTAALSAGTVTSPSLPGQASYGDMAQCYDVVQTYGASDSHLTAGQESLEAHVRTGLDVVYQSNQRTPSARRGPFKDHEKREETAHTRRIGSCIRCRMQRIRVRVH